MIYIKYYKLRSVYIFLKTVYNSYVFYFFDKGKRSIKFILMIYLRKQIKR